MLDKRDALSVDWQYELRIPEFNDYRKIRDILSPELIKFLELWERVDNWKLQQEISWVLRRCSQLISWESFIFEKKSWRLIWKCWIVSINKENWIIEIWYWIGKNFRRKWIVSKSVMSLIRYIFENTEYKNILIRCAIENTASQNLAKNLWFRLRHEAPNILYFQLSLEDYKK